MRSGGLERDFFSSSNELQMLCDQICRDAVEIEPLATAENGGQHLLRLGGCENKFHVRGRLLEGLQKCVKRSCREHVHFVDQINFVTAFGWRVPNVLPQF